MQCRTFVALLHIVCVALAAVQLTVLAPALHAQERLPTLRENALVNLLSGDRDRYIGVVLHSTPDSIVVSSEHGPLTFRSQDIRRIHLGHGPTPWKHARTGAIVGAVAGFAYGLAAVLPIPEDLGLTGIAYGAFIPVLVAGSSMAGGLLGGTLGLSVGLISPSENWCRVCPAPPPREPFFLPPRIPRIPPPALTLKFRL